MHFDIAPGQAVTHYIVVSQTVVYMCLYIHLLFLGTSGGPQGVVGRMNGRSIWGTAGKSCGSGLLDHHTAGSPGRQALSPL